MRGFFRRLRRCIHQRIIAFFLLVDGIRRFSPYMKNGFYFLKRSKGCCYVYKSFLGFPIFSFHKYKSYDNAKLTISEYEKKIIIFTNNYVFHFYNKSRYKPIFFNNIKKYVDLINYPVNRPISLNYKKRLKIEPLVVSDGKKNALNILSFLLSFAASANKIDYSQVLSKWSFVKQNDIFYVQHGDASFSNIIISNDIPVFIDLDTIGIYPFLYDFYRLMIRDRMASEAFFRGFFDEEIETILMSCVNNSIHHISASQLTTVKDYYLSMFLRISRYNIRYLSDLIPSEFKETTKQLKIINDIK